MSGPTLRESVTLTGCLGALVIAAVILLGTAEPAEKVEDFQQQINTAEQDWAFIEASEKREAAERAKFSNGARVGKAGTK